MSSKEKTTTFKSISTEYFCDLCGKESKWKCQICKIDICKDHTVYDPNDFDTDYPSLYCSECWNAGSKNRQEIKEKAIVQIQSNFPESYFILENVIVSNIDFNVGFKNAIEQKKTNEELAKAKEKEVAISQYEADKKIEFARGEAESKKLNAEAVAYETLTKAKAEAEGLALKRVELTQLMIQNNLIDKWSGELPNFLIMGEGDTPNLLLQTPLGVIEPQVATAIVS